MTVEDDINSGDKSNPKTVVGSSSDLNLSFGDPLYLHPNDTSFIDGSCKKDLSNPGLANQWDMCNSVVVTWILNSLSPKLFASAVYTKTAFEILNELKETYDKVYGFVVFNLHKNIHSLNQNGSTLADYYNKLNSLWKQFDVMVGLPSYKGYLAIRNNLLTRESLPSIKTAFYVISGEESHRNVTSAVTTKPAATAFAAKSFDNKKKFNNNYKGSGSNSNFNSNNNNNKGPNPNLKCTDCNKTSHNMDRCFDLIRYPTGYVKRNSNSNSRTVTSNNASADVQSNAVCSNKATTGNFPVSLSIDQLVRLMNLLNENGVSTANANMAEQFRIPSSVLSCKSPYFYVYGHDPSLSHLRVFGCLCYATILNNQDKFSSRSEKCVFIGYSNSKKGYKLLSLENKSIFYSRDVKFYETVFPFKMKNNLKPTEFESGVTEDLNHKIFFDSENPKRPNDEGRVSSNDDGPELSPDINQGNDDSGATSMDETNNTHPEGTVSDEADFINDFYENLEFNYETKELPVHTLRRSFRQTKLPSSLNDFIVKGKVKYGVKRVVNYANLNHDNYCFIFSLNKSVEPTCYEEAILDSNWVDAMNAKIEALNENHTWEITYLPPNRKAIGNKWIYKNKYKSSGDIDRYKARLVVKGFNQKEGIDFDETFSLVVKMSTVRCVVALSVTNNWPLF
ncbi:ribonuclease H-like domain-containing protein [Tanacetum coccineum]